MVNKNLSISVIRKLFHFLAALLFTPVLIFDMELMNLSFCLALSLLIVVELIRYLRCPLFYDSVESYYSSFCSQDGGRKTLHHLYLLGGCAAPSIVHSLQKDKRAELFPFLGIVTLCIGDSFVSNQKLFEFRFQWATGRNNRKLLWQVFFQVASI